MSLPYFPMFPSDFEAKTSHLTLEEDGAYNRLLRLMWMTPECSLPDDDAWIMRRMRCDAETYERVVRVIIDEFCTRENGRVSNAKLTEIFHDSNERHGKRVSAGSRGGKAKALKTRKTAPSNAKAMLKQPEPKPEPKSSSYEEQAREAFALFSAMAERIGCAVPAKFSDARKRSLLARLSECGGMDGWTVALGKVEASSFLRGSAWFGLDWMLKPSNFTKIMEGNYDDRDCASARGSNTGRGGPHDALMAGFARLANSDDGTGGDDFGGGEASYCAGPQEMDGWQGGDSSQPLLRLVGER